MQAATVASAISLLLAAAEPAVEYGRLLADERIFDVPPRAVRPELSLAPPDSDRLRFPPREFISQQRSFSHAFRCKLAEEREVWPAAW